MNLVAEFVRRLVHEDWDSSDALLRLKADLPHRLVGGTRFFSQARLFLAALADQDGLALTASGALNRASVVHLCSVMEWPRETMESLKEIKSKRFNELDVFPLELIRVTCLVAGLARRRGRVLNATKKARSLLAETRSGELYRRLFVTMFSHLNYEYVTEHAAGPLIQESIGYILWQARSILTEWVNVEELPGPLLLRPVANAIRVNPYYDEASWTIYSGVIEPLEWFGLVECQPDGKDPDVGIGQYRKTPLFDRFIGFDLASLLPGNARPELN